MAYSYVSIPTLNKRIVRNLIKKPLWVCSFSGICNPMAAITSMLTLGPMPDVVEQLPEDLNVLAQERNVNQATVWGTFMTYWPSHRVLPYTIPEGWIWVWHWSMGGEIWEVVGLRL